MEPRVARAVSLVMLRRAALAASLTLLAAHALAGGDRCTKSTKDCTEEMKAAIAAKGWAGIEVEAMASGLVVLAVTPGSPAERAGFKVGDVLAALNGIRYTEENKDALHAMKKSLKPGSTARYTVIRGGVERIVAVKLAPVPDDIRDRWMREHLEHDHPKVAN